MSHCIGEKTNLPGLADGEPVARLVFSDRAPEWQ